MKICGRRLFFHVLLLSTFCSRSTVFCQRIAADNDDAVNAQLRVDVAAAERIKMNNGVSVGDATCASFKKRCYLQKLVDVCQSIHLLTYYALKRTVQAKSGLSSADAAGANGDDCDGIAALDGDLSVSMKMEGEGMLLDEMNMLQECKLACLDGCSADVACCEE
ncbi:unnamed protein product [Peronospora belbahrii]|uniref:Uncharacterized protein n=1 Tax=Peronospora belbahrii TaxID=622444 RepID=A0ABN8D2A3_9STRA|nr:unnamed protein product [Peronospora belbahrii]